MHLEVNLGCIKYNLEVLLNCRISGDNGRAGISKDWNEKSIKN